MRLYGRKIADRAINSRINSKREISEGILWTIDQVSETCTVKIQGSDEQIVAHYPRNLTSVPAWLRVGNSVKMGHKRGTRDYIEVTGPGRAIPNPILGDQFPSLSALPDAVLTPVRISPTTENANSVYIDAGVQYRLNGTVYTLAGEGGDLYLLGDESIGLLGTYPFVPLGQVVILLSGNPSGSNFRYDILVAGEDSQVDVVEGSAVSSSPTVPSTPANHVLLGKILRVGGETGVTSRRIGQTWTAPAPSEMVLSMDEELTWDLGDPYNEHDLGVVVNDQYGHTIYDPAGWQLQCKLIAGTGQVYSDDSGYTSDATQIVTTSSYTFSYQRNQGLEIETHPFYEFTLNYQPPLTATRMQRLYAENGDIIGA